MRVPHELSERRTASGQEIYTPLHSHHIVTGAHCMVSTNSPAVLRVARKFFRQTVEPQFPPGLTLRFWVDPAAQSFPPWPQPFFRGLGHLAYAGFDSESSLLLDLRRRSVVGRFSPSMAGDVGYWQRVIFPALVGLASDALGVTVIHCACVERDGAGLLLAGESGAGKSTLSLAMSRRGFAFVSDDWTYLSYAGGQLAAWGLGTPLKLLPDAAQHFPELRNLEPGIALNGERSFEVDPEDVFGIWRSLRCEPRWLVFLERQDKPEHTFVRMSPREAARRLGSAQGRLPRELSRLRETQRATIRNLVERECWLLRYGNSPEDISHALDRFCAVARPNAGGRVTTKSRPLFVRKGPDPTRRLTSTPFAADFCAADCAIRLETNSPALLRLVGSAFPPSQRTQPTQKRFLWRLVTDNDPGLYPPRQGFSGVSADGMHIVNLGHRGFLAVDEETHCAMGFLAEKLLNDGRAFKEIVLVRLLAMTTALPWKPNRLPNLKEGYDRT
jgi:hypothetical protein